MVLKSNCAVVHFFHISEVKRSLTCGALAEIEGFSVICRKLRVHSYKHAYAYEPCLNYPPKELEFKRSHISLPSRDSNEKKKHLKRM